MLFSSSAPANAVYLVEQGRVKLVLTPPLKSGKPFEVVGPGAVLGLSEVMSGSRYNLSAEATEEVHTSFVQRGVLLDFLADHQEYRVHIVRVLSEDLHSLYLRFRSMTPEPRPRKNPRAPSA